MSAPRESLPRTLGVAAGVAFVCSLLVSGAVYWLRPIERASGMVDRNRAVLQAAGLATREADRAEVVDRFRRLKARLVDLDTGEFTKASDVASYDYRPAMDDPMARDPIPAQYDVGKLGTRPRYMPVYLVMRGQALERIVLPFYARGLWSTIFGYVALQSDLTTVAGIAIYQHGETPGIGDRIEKPAWQAQWRGKRLYDRAGALRFRIGGADAAPDPAYRVDAISGATMTVSGLGNALGYWFSPHGYGRFLERLREGGTVE